MASETKTVEAELEELLEQEKFEPPEEFRAEALVTDDSLHKAAAEDPPGWWGEQARDLLDWFEDFDTTLDDSNPPFYKWFEGGKLNACHNALDRHVEAGDGDRVAFHWHGEDGSTRALT
ncbi:MAG: acetyl-CoA synthetase [Gaiellaceae bacterium]|nr:acetyl-CoA synthetase [Gaiellaceae bacterium]